MTTIDLVFNLGSHFQILPNGVLKNIYGTICFVKVNFTILFNIKLKTIIVWIPHPNKHMVMNIDSNYTYLLSTTIIAQD